MTDLNGDSNEEDITTVSSSSTEGASTTSTVDIAGKEDEETKSENVDTVNNEKKEVPAITTSLSELKEEQEQFNAMYDNSNAMNQNSDEFDGKLPNARHLSFRKYLTMQEKRVVVTIRYSGSSGLKSMYLTAAAKIKQLHPDVLIIRDIVTEGSDENGTGSQNAGKKVFEILVDGKRVAGDKDLNNSRQKGNNMGMNTSGIVFVSMRELDVAINKSRKKRRPNTVYESERILGVSSANSEIGDSSAVRLEYLKALSKKID